MLFSHLLLRKYIPCVALFLLLFLGYACKKSASPAPPPIPPTIQDTPFNLTLTVKDTVYNFITDWDDATTTIQLTASAKNATSYKWNFGDSSQEVTTPVGTVEHKYKKTNTYIVRVTAYKGSKDTTLNKSIGKVNVFNGGLELVYTNNDGGTEPPYASDTLIGNVQPLNMFLGVAMEDGNQNLFTEDAAPSSHTLFQNSIPPIYKSTFFFDGLPTTVKMHPYNKGFRFVLVKTLNGFNTNPNYSYSVADYRNITAQKLWEVVCDATTQKILLSGKIYAAMRIVEKADQLPGYTQLAFNAKLITVD